MNKRSRIKVLAAVSVFALAFAAGAPSGNASSGNVEELARATSLSGAVLAAQIAARSNDDEAAVAYYSQSLSLDPDNDDLKRLYFIALVANGRIADAVKVASGIKPGSEQDAVIRLVNAADLIKEQDYANAARTLENPGGGDLDQLVENIVASWAVFGAEGAKKAQERASAAGGPDWARVVADYHSGLIAAAGGDDDGAIAALTRAIATEVFRGALPDTYLRAIEALIGAHTRKGDYEKARAVLETGLQALSSHPPFVAARARIEAGKPLDPTVRTAAEGAAEIFYNVAVAINRQGGDVLAQGYLQLASHLYPAGDPIAMALAAVFEGRKDYERANAFYERIPAGSPFHRRAELEFSLNLNDLKKVDEAKAKLAKLIEEDPSDLQAYLTYGGVLAQHEEYAKAAEIYDKAVIMIGEPKPQHWNLFYRRGIAYERQKLWDKAEPNFLKAIELSPEQADVLNYLGYSWVDQGIRLEEGLEMIRKAVELSPQKGYIIDSLGWAYYRVGRYEDAVRELERAVELLPRDAVLNDHLGDAYWKVGRKLEATFQWNHALASEPEPEEEKKIREKLRVGLTDKGAPTASSE